MHESNNLGQTYFGDYISHDNFLDFIDLCYLLTKLNVTTYENVDTSWNCAYEVWGFK